MASQSQTQMLDITEQVERIRRMSVESDKLHEERLKLEIERYTLDREPTFIAKDYTLRVAALAATIVGVAANALTAVLLHH